MGVMSKAVLNLGIFAHVDAGKTTLTERLLFDNGVTSELGSVDTGTTQTDNNDLERERGITIRSAVASFTTDELQVNLVDTPGHPDFIAEVDRALRVLDGAVLLLSAVEGVQTQTRALMKSLKRLQIPTVIFINKIDRMGARTSDLVADIQLRLTPSMVPLNSVGNAGTRNARMYPRPLDDRNNLMAITEILAENDEGLSERFLVGSVPSHEEILALLTKQTRAALLHPVFFGSALTGEGVSDLVEGIKTLLTPRSADHNDAPRGIIFAIDRVRGAQKVAYLRLYSGALRERQRVTFQRQDPSGRISKFSGRISGLEVIGDHYYVSSVGGRDTRGLGQHGRVSSLIAGNIGKLWGLPQIRVGDHLGDWDNLDFRSNFFPT